jgi:hypothetical protein
MHPQACSTLHGGIFPGLTSRPCGEEPARHAVNLVKIFQADHQYDLYGGYLLTVLQRVVVETVAAKTPFITTSLKNLKILLNINNPWNF